MNKTYDKALEAFNNAQESSLNGGKLLVAIGIGLALLTIAEAINNIAIQIHNKRFV